MKNVLTIILFVVVILALISDKNMVYAGKERVFRVRSASGITQEGDNSYSLFTDSVFHTFNSSLDQQANEREIKKANEEFLAKSFEVYTADVIDSMNTNINNLNTNFETTKNNLNGEVTALKTSIDEKEKRHGQEFEALKTMIENSLSKLPQELVSEKTKQVVKDSILNDVKKELTSMKEAMKKEIIEELKKQ